jgi:hypothetical protein
MHVHIVVRSGPEWKDIIEVFATKRAAQTFIDAKNKTTKSSDDVFEKLSHYIVHTKEVKS